jgi:hypothetical protein
VQYSTVIAGIFQRACDLVETCVQTKISNLSAAKHRFESLAKPGGRSVLWVDAFIAVADELLLRDDTDDRSHAEAYLDFLDSESYLQNAMMADASDECLLLTRYLDSEDFELEELSFEVGRFVRHIIYLFVEGGVFKTKGYAEFAMSTLTRVRVIRLRRGGIKTFGGIQEPSQEVQNRCLQRMSAWAKLAIEVVQTEFPHWEIFQSFSILSLSTFGSKKARENEDQYKTCVKRLAQKFHLDAAALEVEIDDYRHLALHIHTTQKLSAGNAWMEALKRRAVRSETLKSHPQKT